MGRLGAFELGGAIRVGEGRRESERERERKKERKREKTDKHGRLHRVIAYRSPSRIWVGIEVGNKGKCVM